MAFIVVRLGAKTSVGAVRETRDGSERERVKKMSKRKRTIVTGIIYRERLRTFVVYNRLRFANVSLSLDSHSSTSRRTVSSFSLFSCLFSSEE